MYFIVSGEVEVDPGAGAARRRLQSGDFFGEVALITERPRTATVTALSLCRLLVLEKDDFEAFMESYPELKAAVGAAAAKRLAEIDAAAR
jgi:CRP-like cAMP-binding protein